MKYFKIVVIVCILIACQLHLVDTTTKLTYEAFTRGSSIEIVLTQNQLQKTTNDETQRIEISDAQWNAISSEIAQLDVGKIESYPAPSEDRFVDAAMHASLKLTLKDATYTSQTFDHGNPPNELKNLISILLQWAAINE